MKAKTKFMKMFYKLPEQARVDLVHQPYGTKPMTLAVCSFEIRNNTKLGDIILEELGYKDG